MEAPSATTAGTPPATDRPPARRPPGAGVPRSLLVVMAVALVVMTGAAWMALSPAPSAPTDPSVHRLSPGPGPVAADEERGGEVEFDLIGRKAPAATFTLLADPGGAPHDIGELRGTPVVLNLWASWCSACVREMPALEQVHRAYGDRVRFLGVAIGDSPAAAGHRAHDTGVTYELGLDDHRRVATAFGIVTIPTTMLIDADGTVVHTELRALTSSRLDALVREKLGLAGPGAGADTDTQGRPA